MSMGKMLKTVAGALVLAALAGCTLNVGINKKPKAIDTRGAAPSRTPVYRDAGFIIARASMHNHTTYSDGCRTPEDLLELAREQGMAILAFTDHREGRVCGGKSELLCAKVGGVEAHGYDVYFDHLRRVQAAAAAQNMIVLKGLEFFPYFYNYGKLPALTLEGLQRHFTVYHLDDPAVLLAAPAAHVITFKPLPIPDLKPWQDFVDYITSHGGMVHAVHVEDGEDVWYGPAHGAVPPPIQDLRLQDLTGFSVLPSGWHEQAGGPGGVWDEVLAEYLYGLRGTPLWAMADADYHCEQSLAIATTLFYLRDFTEDDVYKCLIDGRMVALQGDAFQDTYVAEWSVGSGAAVPHQVMLGEQVKVSAAPVVSFKLNQPVAGASVRLIRNGQVIHQQQGHDFTFRDDEAAAARAPIYYRVEVIGPRADRKPNTGDTQPDSELFVNPIFVRFF